MRGVAPGYVSRKIEFQCRKCGKTVKAWPSQKKRYCSKSCGRSGVAIDRFWDKVDKSAGPDGCWIWEGSVTHDGYGRFTVDKVQRLAHRYAYAVTYQAPKATDLVCHKCDVTFCCNPSHLFIGTCADNSADMVSKGRQLAGERNHKAKLTEDQVREIRAIVGESHYSIAERYGVSRPVIDSIVRRKIWKCVA